MARMSRRLRIAVVTNMWPSDAEPAGGIFVRREVEELRRSGGLEVDVVNVRTAQARSRYVTQWARVRRSIRAVDPDIVHFHYGLSQLLEPWWRGPSVVTFHGSDLTIPWQRCVSTAAMRLHPRRRAIVVSGHLLTLATATRGEPRIIPCGVDTSLFRPMDKSEMRSLLGLPQERPVIMFPASPQRAVKNHALFREVVRRVGRQLGEEPTTIDLHHVDPHDAVLRYGAADVVVLTSRHEGSPLVVKEALACRRPVVSVPVGDVRGYCRGSVPCAVSGGWDAGELADLVCASMDVGPERFAGIPVPSLEAEASSVRDVYVDLANDSDSPNLSRRVAVSR